MWRCTLVSLGLVFLMPFSARAQPVHLYLDQPRPAHERPGDGHQRLYREDGNDDLALWCSGNAARYTSGVENVVDERGEHCVYHYTRHLLVGHVPLTFLLHRHGSEHEEHTFLSEDVAFVDAEGTLLATIPTLVIHQQESVSSLRFRRFILVPIADELGHPQPGVCIETIEEQGPGSFRVWALERHRRPWRPHARHRAVDAWIFENGRLLRRSALDGTCPARGYARFVEGDPSATPGAVESRRTIGEATLPDALPTPSVPPYVSPWRRGQRLSLRHMRRAFPGYARYWGDTAGFGYEPQDREPLLCAGDRAGTCLIRVALLRFSEAREMGEQMGMMTPNGEDPFFSGDIVVRDPRRDGPGGVRVGTAYRDVADNVTQCVVSHGDFEGMTCRSTLASVEVWFTAPPGEPHDSCFENPDDENPVETPCPGFLDAARVSQFSLESR